MCTAIHIVGERGFLGRTLDVERGYGETAVIVPRRFALSFLHEATMPVHPAMVGMALVYEGQPLFFDAVNEAGLAAAGLRFAQSAVYTAPRAGMHNVASFELIPWLLSRCRTLSEAAALLRRTAVTAESVSPELPAQPLHWIVADSSGAIAVEPLDGGLMVTADPFGVLTNEPPFAYHAAHAASLLHLSPESPANSLCPDVPLVPFSGGLGAMGLPGDFSSPSRFVRAVFARASGGKHVRTAGDFFRLMDAVSVPRGCVIGADGGMLHTAWASCYDAAGTLHVTSAACRRICAVSLRDADLDADVLTCVPLAADEDILRL